ncbi:aromatic-L-amino-acid decarboxylase [Hyaloraphidium curvatum]|nr:aromatic-L-amino-acid decarboxylase [Hyaloraphidium curvatum]
MSIEDFRRNAKAAVDAMCDYFAAVPSMPVASQVKPGYLAPRLPGEAPEAPDGFEEIMKDFNDHIMPGITHWQSPNFFAFYPATSSYPSLIGDMLGSMINCIGFNWICSPACTELEVITLDWLSRLLGLPSAYLSSGRGGGVIQQSASDATFVAMVAARQRALRKEKERLGDKYDEREALGKLVVYLSEEAHSCHKKGAMVLKLGIRTLHADNAYSLRGETLDKAVAEDLAAGLIPCFAVATVGSTSTGSSDALGEVAAVCARREIWMHVDAAYAGAALVCEEHRGLVEGITVPVDGKEFVADSFDYNPHKWGFVNFDLSAMWFSDRTDLVDAMSITPAYLRNKASLEGAVTDFRDWQLPLGRRFRSLKLWFVLRSFGASGLRTHIRKDVALAQLFESLVVRSPLFELTVPRSLSLVCFRLRPSALPAERVDAANRALAERVNARDDIFITASEVREKPERTVDGKPAMVYFLRLVIGGRSREEHVRKAYEIIEMEARGVLREEGVKVDT